MFGWAPWGHTGAPLSLSLSLCFLTAVMDRVNTAQFPESSLKQSFENFATHTFCCGSVYHERSQQNYQKQVFLKSIFFFFLLWVEDSDVMFEWSAALKRTFTSRVKTLTSLLLHYIMNMQTYLSMSLWSVNYQIRVYQRWTGEVRGRGGRDIDFFFFCPGCSQLMLGAWANWATMTPFNWIYEFCGLTWIFTSYNFQLCRASLPQLHELLIGNTYAEYDGKRHKISNCKIKAQL